MKYALAAALLAVSAQTTAADQPAIDDFAYVATVETTGDAGLYRFELPFDVYRDTARPDLGDIRIFNGRGEVVPHALRRVRRDRTVRQAGQRLPLFALRGDPQTALNAVRVTIESEQGAVDVETRDPGPAGAEIHAFIADARSMRRPLAALEVEWPDETTEFAARIDVAASDDLGSWTTVREDAPIVNLTAGAGKLVERRVEFPARQARFWRLSWGGTSRQAPILNAVVAEPAADRVTAEPAWLTVPPSPDESKAHDFIFDLGARLPVDRVTLELPEKNTVIRAQLFSRLSADAAWLPVTRAGFFRLIADGVEIRNLPVHVSGAAGRFWRVQVDPAGGGVGGGAPGLTVGWFPHEIVFAARGQGPFTLSFGSATVAPVEAAMESLIPAAAMKAGTTRGASLGPMRLAGGKARLTPPPEPFPWKAALLWAVLIGGAALLGLMAYRLAREMGK